MRSLPSIPTLPVYRTAWWRAVVLAWLIPWFTTGVMAQSEGYEKDAALAAATVTFDRASLPLSEIFAQAERQTEYRFVYVATELPLSREIRLPSASGQTLGTVLRLIEQQTGVRFHRTGRQIAARSEKAGTSASVIGRVRDAATGRYLLGATVTLRELSRQVITANDGGYVFSDVPAGGYTAVAESIGYRTMTQPVSIAGGSNVHDFSLESDLVTLGKFVVEGEREGLARALQEKRTADSIMDIVSADSAGKLPDGNAAEAVRRLPGVFAEIDQNEGRYIVVRGIDSSLNNVTINGVSVGSPDGGSRATAMDAVPADLISRIEVIKAVTPAMDAQAIGASVNVVTPSAFDRSEPFAYGTFAGGYFNGPRSEFRKHKLTPYSGSATLGTTFGGGRWGVVVGGSYSYRHYISNRRSGGGEWFPSAASGDGANIYFPATQSLYHYDVQRWRSGVNAALEFRPSDQHQYFVRLTDNFFKDDEGRNLNSFDFFRTTYPTSYTATGAHFTGGRSTVEYRRYLQKHNIANLSAGGKDVFDDGAMTFDYTVAVGDADLKVPNREDWEFRSAANLVSDIDTSTLYWKVTPAASSNFYDPATYPFRRVRFRSDDQTESNTNLAANLKRDQRWLGQNGYWQVGAKFFSHDKSWDRQNVDYNAATGAYAFNLSQFGLSEAAPTVFGGRFQMTPQINLDAIRAFFASNPNYFVANPSGSLSDSYVNDLAMKEQIGAGYAMARTTFGKWSLLAGVRAENTDVKVTQSELPTANSTTQSLRYNRFTKTYTNVLPAVHLRYQPRRNWVLRAAWTNTIGRPNYADAAGASTFSYVETETGSGVYTGSISSGNPDLRPYRSSNFDVTSEYYFSSTGIFSVSGFMKRIKDPIFTNAYTLRNTTYEGLKFDSLSYSRPENASAGKISGVEVAYQQQLTMLPSPFNGLGFSVNFTYSDSHETLFTRPNEQLPFAKQAERIGNVALSYEKYGVQFRVAYTHTGAFIKSFGSSINSDSYQSSRNTVDAKISYRLTRHLTVFADATNIGQEPLDEFAGYSSRNSATEIYWWTANFGLNWKL